MVPDDGSYIWYVRVKSYGTTPDGMRPLHIAEEFEGGLAFLSEPMTRTALNEKLQGIEVSAAFRVLEVDQ